VLVQASRRVRVQPWASPRARRCPIRIISGRSSQRPSTSALFPQADIQADVADHVSVMIQAPKRELESCDMNSATANGMSSGRCSQTKLAAFPAWTTGAFPTASFGSCDQVHHGVISEALIDLHERAPLRVLVRRPFKASDFKGLKVTENARVATGWRNNKGRKYAVLLLGTETGNLVCCRGPLFPLCVSLYMKPTRVAGLGKRRLLYMCGSRAD
jgi:hypothetical protein